MRSITGMCVLFGTLLGGYVPVIAWGDSGFSLVSVVGGAVGGAAGVWLAVRLQA